jgi:hypothetical protein
MAEITAPEGSSISVQTPPIDPTAQGVPETTPAPAVSPAEQTFQKNFEADTGLATSGQIEYARDGWGFFETAGETWMQETWIGQAARYGWRNKGLYQKDRDVTAYEYSPDFNPYKFFADNKAEFGKMQPHIMNGLFDDVFSEGQFRDRAERLLVETRDRENLANGNGAGTIVGGLLSFADVSTFIPGVNVAKKLGTATKVGKALNSRPVKWAATGAYASAVQEAGLHQFQDLRTLEESEMNTLIGAGFGGVLGLAASKGGKLSLLNPKNENFVLGENAPLRMGIKAFGQKVSESPAFSPVIRGGKDAWDTVAGMPIPGTGGSVGAAAVKGVDMLKAGGEKVGGVVRGAVQAVGKAGQYVVSNTLAKATPIGRGLTAMSEKARTLTSMLYDTGGILLTPNASGRAVKSFEDVANGFANDVRSLNVAVREVYTGLQMRLAELAGGSTSALGVAARDTMSNVRALGRDVAAGPSASGTPRETGVRETGTRLERFEFEDLIEMSMRDDVDQAAIDNLVGRFGKDGADAILDTAKQVGENIHLFNQHMEDTLVEQGLLRDADRLGRKFVAPQLWSGKGIRANEAQAKAFFMRVLANEPSDEFLDANVITRDEFNKLGKEPVTIGGKEYSIDQGIRHKNDLLGAWSGELRDNKVAALELELEATQADYKAKKKELILATRELRRTETEIKNATVEEAEAILKHRIAARDKARVDIEKARLEKAKAEADAKAAKAEADAANPEEALKAGIENYAGAAGGQKTAVKEAEDMFDLMLKDGDPNGIKAAQDNLVEADNALWSEQQRALDAAQNRRDYTKRIQEKRAAAEAKATAAQARSAQLAKDIVKMEQRLARLEGPLETALALIEKTKVARQNVQIVKKLRNEAVNQIRKETGKTYREWKRAKKAARKFKGETVEEYVEELVEKLSSRDSGLTPMNMIEGGFMESGRTRLRFLKLDNAQFREAKQLGLLRGDLMGRLEQGYTDLGRQVAMRQTFGHYGSTHEEILKGLKREVKDDYDSMIAKAQDILAKADTPWKKMKAKRDLKRLEGEKRTFLGESGGDEGDITKGFRRQFGMLDLPTDPESMLTWLTSKAREFNFIRYGSGFLISSLTDPAHMLLTSGFGTFSYKTAKAMHRTMSGMANDELRRLLAGSELIMHNSRNFKLNSMDDMRLQAGIGDYGTVKHYLTSSTDRLFNGMSQTTSYMSGMLWWNTRLKMMAMVEMQHNFVELASKYDRLLKEASAGNKASELEIARLASLGLGQEEMRGIITMLNKHAPQKVDDVWELGMGRWLNEGKAGRQAYDDVLTALDHVAGRAVMTPSKGDTPFLMSNTYFKMLLQFQTYGFAIVNRYMLPAFQRMANYGDMEAFLSMGLMLMMGGTVTAAKDIINKGEIKDRELWEWGYDAWDRAGFFAYLSTLSSFTKQSLTGEGASRYSAERQRWALLLGPTGSLTQDIWDLGSSVSEGDSERAKKVALKLAPLNMYTKLYKMATGE